jgi:hypothetical protein
MNRLGVAVRLLMQAGQSSKTICVLALLPALMAVGGVDLNSGSFWAIQSANRRNARAWKRQQEEFRAAHPEHLAPDLRTANQIVAERNPDKISIVERETLKSGVTLNRTISVEASSWHSEPPMTFLDSTDYSKVP